MQMRSFTLACAVTAATALLGGCKSDGSIATDPAADPPEVTVGERLFLDTRFAQYFAAHSGGNVNDPLAQSDPTVARFTKADGSSLPSPFAGQSINCRQCHIVDEALDEPGGGMRTYADFASRSPVPDRSAAGDATRTTPRNAQPLVNSTLFDAACETRFNPMCDPARRPDFVMHFDGEFASVEDLVAGTLTGRDFGWLPGEYDTARAHVAKVICEDDGSTPLDQESGGSYRDVLGKAANVPAAFDLPDDPRFRLNLPQDCDGSPASNEKVLRTVSNIIAEYLRSLQFARNPFTGIYTGSPYDSFLLANALQPTPNSGQSDKNYAEQLRVAVNALGNPIFVGSEFGPFFEFHQQARHFGAQELKGLKLFLSTKAHPAAGGSVGNCVSCHAPPNFTDFGLHDTGISQLEYDGLHGDGAFMAMAIPDAATRDADLPGTNAHPNRSGRFRAPADASDAGRTDLGVWNIAANSDFPAPQAAIENLLCGSDMVCRSDDNILLGKAVAAFKTPGLRDLGHSQPYMHNGGFANIEAAVRTYRKTSQLERDGKLKNGDPALQDIQLTPQDVDDISAFLRALNEDYS